MGYATDLLKAYENFISHAKHYAGKTFTTQIESLNCLLRHYLARDPTINTLLQQIQNDVGSFFETAHSQTKQPLNSNAYKSTVTSENAITLVPLKGVRTKQHITIALVAYIPISTFCFGKTFPDHLDKNEQAILNKPMNPNDHASYVGSSPSSLIDGGK